MKKVIKIYHEVRLLIPTAKEENQRPIIIQYPIEKFLKGIGTDTNSSYMEVKAAKYAKNLRGWKRLKSNTQVPFEDILKYKNEYNAEIVLYSGVR